jgi:hypothetical protein
MRSENIVAHTNPPITTRASGLELSDPIPADMAAGSNPMVAMNAVISTGRISEFTPRFTAVYKGFSPRSLSRFCLNAVVSKTPSNIQIPNRAINPMPADMLKFVPVISRATMPPTTAKGTLRKTRPASFRFQNMINNRRNISNKLIGTTSISLLEALC